MLLLIALTFLLSYTEANPSGFTVNLIHRDSTLSPYFNSSKTPYENLRNSVTRARARSAHFFTQNLDSSSSSFQSPLTAEPAEYLMKISVGTPPVDLLAVADTGSDLAWTQCEPCTQCYQQDTPLFNPEKSSTYVKQTCDSQACQSLSTTSCDDNNKCSYEVSYGDKSFSKGDLAFESLTFESTSGSPVVLPNISFGCGHINGGNFDKFTTGIVGLGNGPLSIVSQLNDTINGKFSYCLAPLGANVSSKVSFGSNAVVSGDGVQTTPFFTSDSGTFYYLDLESVSVGKTNVKFEKKKYTSNKAGADAGNIVIDSGTTITFLPTEFYQNFENEFKSSISSTPVEGAEGFSLCYRKEQGFEEKVPTVTFHFSGADLDLGASNTLLEVEEGVLCLAISQADDDMISIFGNVQQMNYLIGYDLVKETVSFKKSDCTNL
ncbi:hypothetical protein DCAR_0312707 [Daucus carota subsp. sativus]|uniref:Peptidase A1 domain-containing protein n=2 Tax=Daucus carota subsp. sativus TaxID=79200 RepID=A0AAF0WS17_DAUCS|nr:hypothetical protein DCAR_0312707 [Daucus carota subsp. sativus]